MALPAAATRPRRGLHFLVNVGVFSLCYPLVLPEFGPVFRPQFRLGAQRRRFRWVGRRLDAAEAARLPPACVVFDVCTELAENAVLRAHPYRHFPLLDLEPPAAAAIAEIVAALALEIGRGRSVYLHCAMGYSRSIFIAQCYFDKYPR